MPIAVAVILPSLRALLSGGTLLDKPLFHLFERWRLDFFFYRFFFFSNIYITINIYIIIYIYEKAMETVTGQSANEATSRAIDWGNEWEEHALKQLQIALNSPEESTELKPSFKLFNDYFGCSPDAFMVHPEFGPVGCEIKCPWNSVNHFLQSQVQTGEDLKRVNSDYYWQVMGNMLTFNLPAWVFASYDPRQPEHRRLHHTVILFDPEAAAALCEAMERAQAYKYAILQDWMKL